MGAHEGPGEEREGKYDLIDQDRAAGLAQECQERRPGPLRQPQAPCNQEEEGNEYRAAAAGQELGSAQEPEGVAQKQTAQELREGQAAVRQAGEDPEEIGNGD